MQCKTMHFFCISKSSLRNNKLCLVSNLNCLYKEIRRFNSETVHETTEHYGKQSLR